MSGDADARAAETARLWTGMAASHDLPERAMIDLRFVAGEGADAVEFMGWLEDAGFEVEHYPADEDEDGEPEPAIVEAQTAEVALTLAAVQAAEARTAEVASRFGFVPDGWGFIAP